MNFLQEVDWTDFTPREKIIIRSFYSYCKNAREALVSGLMTSTTRDEDVGKIDFFTRAVNRFKELVASLN